MTARKEQDKGRRYEVIFAPFDLPLQLERPAAQVFTFTALDAASCICIYSSSMIELCLYYEIRVFKEQAARACEALFLGSRGSWCVPGLWFGGEREESTLSVVVAVPAPDYHAPCFSLEILSIDVLLWLVEYRLNYARTCGVSS